MDYFKGEHNGHEITVKVHTDGSVNYTTEVFQEQGKYYMAAKEFTSLDTIKAAIDKYELSLRKNFKNTTAYMFVHPYYAKEREIEKVTVTSITPNEKSAWIKTSKNERRKVSLSELYKDREVCQAYIAALAATSAVYQKERETLKSIVDKHLWKPEVKS